MNNFNFVTPCHARSIIQELTLARQALQIVCEAQVLESQRIKAQVIAQREVLQSLWTI